MATRDDHRSPTPGPSHHDKLAFPLVLSEDEGCKDDDNSYMRMRTRLKIKYQMYCTQVILSWNSTFHLLPLGHHPAEELHQLLLLPDEENNECKDENVIKTDDKAGLLVSLLF